MAIPISSGSDVTCAFAPWRALLLAARAMEATDATLQTPPLVITNSALPFTFAHLRALQAAGLTIELSSCSSPKKMPKSQPELPSVGAAAAAASLW
eukprot:CAMPEP_0178393128 /NCGR_PEP_ID=MMETSP0689_2-20121128/12029_1 /TAXON_ID=160604 /ORGANISM="Amphidinium massartii, Strain CS-259" /LENGTH=95 /DNA_ID=CAMNT_0020013713 /DNA_START=485 /DNA_END=770 /DNA_ORIENTATION=+